MNNIDTLEITPKELQRRLRQTNLVINRYLLAFGRLLPENISLKSNKNCLTSIDIFVKRFRRTSSFKDTRDKFVKY